MVVRHGMEGLHSHIPQNPSLINSTVHSSVPSFTHPTFHLLAHPSTHSAHPFSYLICPPTHPPIPLPTYSFYLSTTYWPRSGFGYCSPTHVPTPPFHLFIFLHPLSPPSICTHPSTNHFLGFNPNTMSETKQIYQPHSFHLNT